MSFIMVGTPRQRYMDQRVPQVGSLFNRLGTPQNMSRSRWSGPDILTDDVVGNPLGANPFRSITTRVSHGTLGGEYITTWAGVDTLQKGYYGCPVAGIPAPSGATPSWMVDPTGIDIHNLGWDALAAANPSAPHVSVPTALGELKDLPELVEGWGKGRLRDLRGQLRNLPKNAANANLVWRWGISPMISDLGKLLDFQKAVSRRLAMLKQLGSGKYLRRKVTLGQDEAVDERVEVVESQLAVVYASKVTRRHRKVWATVRYYNSPLSGNIPQDSTRQRELAERITFGITKYEALATAWELVPWSWLQDWFSNFGGYIKGMNNSLGLVSSHGCVMVMDTTAVTYSYYSAPSWCKPSLGTHRYDRIVRRRYPFPLTIIPPLPTVPVISGAKWSILGSLAALKAK